MSSPHNPQSHDAADEGEYKEDTPPVGRFFEEEDAHQNSTYGSDACPYGVSCSHGNGLRCFVEEYETEGYAYEKGSRPQQIGEVLREFEACCEGHFKEACNHQNDPVHGQEKEILCKSSLFGWGNEKKVGHIEC